MTRNPFQQSVQQQLKSPASHPSTWPNQSTTKMTKKQPHPILPLTKTKSLPRSPYLKPHLNPLKKAPSVSKK